MQSSHSVEGIYAPSTAKLGNATATTTVTKHIGSRSAEGSASAGGGSGRGGGGGGRSGELDVCKEALFTGLHH